MLYIVCCVLWYIIVLQKKKKHKVKANIAYAIHMQYICNTYEQAYGECISHIIIKYKIINKTQITDRDTHTFAI